MLRPSDVISLTRRAAPALIIAVGLGCAPGEAGLSPADREAIRSVMEGYGAGWRSNDSATVLATLAGDVVFLPPDSDPVIGLAAVTDYLFPQDGSTTTTTTYREDVDDIRGAGGFAVVRGSARFEFVWIRDEERLEGRAANKTLTIVRRATTGTWRITHRMWNPLPAP